MAKYGDPEAHRCILQEIIATSSTQHLISYLKAAAMGSQGSDVGVQMLQGFRERTGPPDSHLEVMLALLSLTVLASKADPYFRAEQKRVREMLSQRRAALVQQADYVMTLRGGGADNSCSSPPTSAAVPHLTMCDSDINTTLPAVIKSTAFATKEEKLTPVQQWEQSMDILNYCEAYANYLGGFTALWYELFGPNYDYAASTEGCPDNDNDNDNVDVDDGAEEDGAKAQPTEGGNRVSSSSPLSSLSSQEHSPKERRRPRFREQSSRCPQVPPHLYAVRWGEILTPHRRAWFHGIHNLVKELLVRILHRELPLELYVLFIQYANLSLRMYLLETLAKVFEWTSHCIDVIRYVHVMRQSYNIQCEMLQLQRMWSSFGLYDSHFYSDCGEFNRMYAELQGAFSDQRVVWPVKPATVPPTATSLTGYETPETVPKARHPQQNPSGTSSTTAVLPPHMPPSAAVSATTQSTSSTAGVGERVCRIFPVCDAAGNISSDAPDAGHSTASRTPEDEALSSASEYGEVTHMPGSTKHAVYLPLFYTCCCFTWILQRTFWSMYGRCALLFESCLGIEAVSQVSSVDCSGGVDKGDAPVLFTTTQPNTWRRAGSVSSGSNANSMAATTFPMGRTDGGAAARVNAVSSSISVTTTQNNLTTRRHALEAHGRARDDDRDIKSKAEALASMGRPPHAPRGYFHSTPLSQHYPEYMVETANTPVPAGVAMNGVEAEAMGAHVTPVAPTPESKDEGRAGEGTAFSWGSVLGRLVQRGQSRQDRLVETAKRNRNAGHVARSSQDAHLALSLLSATLSGCLIADSAAGAGVLEGHTGILSLRSSGVPFHLQYTHREHEARMYDDPSHTCMKDGVDSQGGNTVFFEEFYFLQKTGCYVLSHALRSLTCYPRYPATLLVLTDNTTRPGRVSWFDHKLSILSSSTDDGQVRQGMTPWVLNAVIPHTRLSSNPSLRANQEKALLKHVVFQVAGTTRPRMHFCTPNSIFFILNSGREMDGGRLYFALHLHVDLSTRKGAEPSMDAVMEEESQWAFRALSELHVSWAMSCTCNEALRVAFQIGYEEVKM